MVAANPLFVGGNVSRKFRATVVNDIWPEVLFFTLVATSEWHHRLWFDVAAHRRPFPSGDFGVGNDRHIFGHLKSDANGPRYRPRFSHLVPDVHGLRKVGWYAS